MADAHSNDTELFVVLDLDRTAQVPAHEIVRPK